MPEQGEFYRRLQISRWATPADVRAAYLRRARQLHPDLNADRQAADAAFKRLQEAYETLRDPRRRLEYDARVVHQSRGSVDRSPPSTALARRPVGTWSFEPARPPLHRSALLRLWLAGAAAVAMCLATVAALALWDLPPQLRSSGWSSRHLGPEAQAARAEQVAERPAPSARARPDATPAAGDRPPGARPSAEAQGGEGHQAGGAAQAQSNEGARGESQASSTDGTASRRQSPHAAPRTRPVAAPPSERSPIDAAGEPRLDALLPGTLGGPLSTVNLDPAQIVDLESHLDIGNDSTRLEMAAPTKQWLAPAEPAWQQTGSLRREGRSGWWDMETAEPVMVRPDYQATYRGSRLWLAQRAEADRRREQARRRGAGDPNPWEGIPMVGAAPTQARWAAPPGVTPPMLIRPQAVAAGRPAGGTTRDPSVGWIPHYDPTTPPSFWPGTTGPLWLRPMPEQ